MTQFPGLGDIELAARQAEWTVREIAQQPAMWRQVARDVGARRGEIARFLAPLLAQPDLRIVLAGAGTSSFAGQILAPHLARALGRRVEAIATTDIAACPHDAFPRDEPVLLVSFARSGSSPESIATTGIAEALLPGCRHLVVTCNRDGELFGRHSGREDSLVLLMPEGTNDRAFAMTSSFTSMMLAALLALAGGEEGPATAERLAAAAAASLATNAGAIRRLADGGLERVVYLGSGALKGLAQESALKLLELTAGRIVAYHDTPLGFRHGPKSIVDPKTLLVVYLSNDPQTRRYDLDLLAELRQGGGSGGVIAVSAQDLPAGGERWQIAGLGAAADAELAIAAVVPAQMLALAMSLAAGCTPDNPFPAGEVNRVVQGVVIHPLAGGGG